MIAKRAPQRVLGSVHVGFGLLLLLAAVPGCYKFLHGGRSATRSDELRAIRKYKTGRCWGIRASSPDYWLVKTNDGVGCYSRTHEGHGLVATNKWKEGTNTAYFYFANINKANDDTTATTAEKCVIPDNPTAKGVAYWFNDVTVEKRGDVYKPMVSPQGECELIPLPK